MKVIYILSILVFLTSNSCSKAKSSKWLVADIVVYDEVTGAPIQTNLRLKYREQPPLAQVYDVDISLGITDSEGKFQFEREISKRQMSFELVVQLPQYYTMSNFFNGTVTRPLHVNSENVLYIPVKPRYPFRLRAINDNCTSPSDSVFISFVSEYAPFPDVMKIGVGCADTTFLLTSSATSMHLYNSVVFAITTKKSGVINNYTETYNLAPAELTDIELHY